MAVTHPYMSENIWFDKARCEDAEADYYSGKCGTSVKTVPGSIASEIARAREQIQKALKSDGGVDSDLAARIEKIELENKELRQVTDDLRQIIKNLENRISTLEVGNKSAPAPAKPAVVDNKEAADNEDEDDDDFELFGSDDEEENAAAEKLKEERLAAYAAKKAKKPALIAKSNVILDVKPWDDETDMAELEKHVRSIVMDGLLWGVSKLVPVGYGIKKLQICTVIEDDKVSVDELEEKITDFEDFVQSVDIAAFNKI